MQPTAAAQQESFFSSIDAVLLQDFVQPVLPLKLDHHAYRGSIYQTHLFQHLLGHTETGRNGALLAPITNPTDLNRFVISPSFTPELMGENKASGFSFWAKITSQISVHFIANAFS